MANMTDLTEQLSNRAEGSIASAFASLSNQSNDLPARLLRLKQDISRGNGDAILDGWHWLLERVAVDKLAQWDSHMIPELEFSAIKSNNGNLPDHAKQALKERGTIIVRGIVSPGEALAWKQRIRDYVSANPSTTGFPGDSSVLYIPAAPLCEVNSYYLRNQRNQFLQSRPPPDFPGGVGESQHKHRGTLDDLSDRGKRAMGCLKFDAPISGSPGQQAAARLANTILGFDVD